MDKKYEIVKDQSIEVNGQPLYRIRALRDIVGTTVKAGDIGGYVSHEHNLSQFGKCWIYNDAKMFDRSRMHYDACILNYVEMYDDSRMGDNSEARDHAKLFNCAEMVGSSFIAGNTELHDKVVLKGNSCIVDGHLTERHHYMAFVNVGSENGTLHVFKTKTGIHVDRGCFNGTVEEFLKAVEEKYGDNEFAVEYKDLIAVAVRRINR